MYYFNHHDTTLTYPSLVVATICVFAYFLASTFINLYKMVIDTLVICFCEDASNNKEQPFMSERLKVGCI